MLYCLSLHLFLRDTVNNKAKPNSHKNREHISRAEVLKILQS